MVPSPLVAAVILNWNDAASTLKCLNGLRRQDPVPVSIVCDNGSTDASPEAVCSWARAQELQLAECTGPVPSSAAGADVYLVRNGSNLGYAAGNNPGIRLALNMGAEYIWILNNDARPLPGALAALLNGAEQQREVGLFGATVVYANDPERIEAAGGCRYNPLTTVSRPAHAGQLVAHADGLPEPQLSYIYGACLFARAEVFRRVGLLNEEFFLFYEELDLCRRAQRAGYGLAWRRDALVEHEGAHSVDARDKSFIQYHENLSTVLYTRLHHPGLLFPALAIRLLAKLIFLPLRGDFGQISAVCRAYSDGLKRRLK